MTVIYQPRGGTPGGSHRPWQIEQVTTMGSLHIKIAGLDFENPLWLASGPWGGTGQKLRKVALDGRPGAVVTKSIAWEPKIQASPRAGRAVYDRMFYGVDKSDSFSAKEWFRQEIPVAREGGVPVITDINLGTEPLDVWEETGKMAEDSGATAIELGFGAPSHGIGFLIDPNHLGYRILECVKKVVSLPVFVKIPYLYPLTHLKEFVGGLVDSGVDGIVTCGNVAATLVDIEAAKHTIGAGSRIGTTYGEIAKPVSLAAVLLIASNFSIPVIGTGGIRSGEDVIEFIMAGASATQLLMEAMLKGPLVFQKINEQILNWMENHGVSDLSEIRGNAYKTTESVDSFRTPIAVDDRPCECIPE
ncbi:MAG: tRNA-dihydrouridine synthase [Desulfatiglandales bacterium]|nr:tRNA-dihydrouridine synthase [Desulfatiglandales bacterium]